MKKITFSRVVILLLSLPKTIYFNVKVFGFAGIKLPIFICYRTHLSELHKGVIKLDFNDVKLFNIIIGFGGSTGIPIQGKPEICLEKGSILIFKGKAQFADGCGIRNSGTIILGQNFGMNRNSVLSCYDSVSIGDNFTGGWNISIRDSDGHYIIKDKMRKELHAPVVIGNRVWMCSYSHIMKGVSIPDDCVIAYRSLVLKSCSERNVMLGGTPATVIQRDIDWEY